MPMSSFAGDQGVGTGWAPGSAFVFGWRWGIGALRGSHERIDDGPGALDLVAAHE